MVPVPLLRSICVPFAGRVASCAAAYAAVCAIVYAAAHIAMCARRCARCLRVQLARETTSRHEVRWLEARGVEKAAEHSQQRAYADLQRRVAQHLFQLALTYLVLC